MLVHCKCQQVLKLCHLALISISNTNHLHINALEALTQSRQKGQTSRSGVLYRARVAISVVKQ